MSREYVYGYPDKGDNDAIIIIIIIIGKVKGKDHPITGHEGSGGSRGIALLVL